MISCQDHLHGLSNIIYSAAAVASYVSSSLLFLPCEPMSLVKHCTLTASCWRCMRLHASLMVYETETAHIVDGVWDCMHRRWCMRLYRLSDCVWEYETTCCLTVYETTCHLTVYEMSFDCVCHYDCMRPHRFTVHETNWSRHESLDGTRRFTCRWSPASPLRSQLLVTW